MKNKKGYTLVELLAIIAILALIVGLSSTAFFKVQKNVLEKDYQNIIAHIEASANQYANDTGIYGTITVQDLIDAGYITPDDKEYIYNPVDNRSINCMKIDITYDDNNAIFSIKYKKNDSPATSSGDGKCVIQENSQALEICKINGSNCDSIGNGWYTSSVTIGVKKPGTSEALGDGNNYLWKPSGLSSKTIMLENEGTHSVSVDVRFGDSALDYGSASKVIKIDSTGPVFDKIENNKVYYKDSGSGVNKICFFTSKPANCNNLTGCQSASSGSRTITETAKYACANDKAGNVSSEPKGLIKTINVEIDETNAGTVKVGDKYSSVVLKGRALDNIDGIKAYAFTKSSSTPSSWNNISLTTDDVIQYSSAPESGTYYFWVKDGNNNTSKAQVNVEIMETIVEPEIKTKTISLRDYNKYIEKEEYISDINEVKSVELVNSTGSVTYEFNKSQKKVKVMANNGTAHEETTITDPITTPAKSKEATLSCSPSSQYECPNGGVINNKTCVQYDAEKLIKEIIRDTNVCAKDSSGNMQYYTNKAGVKPNCRLELNMTSSGYNYNNLYTCSSSCNCTHDDHQYLSPRCPTGYEMSKSPNTVTGCDTHKYETVTCTWTGNYSATCKTKSYSCSAGENYVASNHTCQYCDEGTLDASGVCTKEGTVITKYYYQYTVKITYT